MYAMQKWEYKTVTLLAGRVYEVDDKELGHHIGLWTGFDGESFHEYLSKLGEDGWEVCGTAPTAKSHRTFIILKRPKS